MRQYITKTFIITLVVFLLAGLTKVEAQKARIKYADNLYEELDFRSALRAYERINEKIGGEEAHVLRRMAECHEHLREIENAEPYYAALINKFPDEPFYKFKMAQSLMKQGQEREQEAFDYMRQYVATQQGITNFPTSYNANYLGEDPMIEVQNEDFNTGEYDFSPFIVFNDFYFVSTRQKSDLNDPWLKQSFAELYTFSLDSADSPKPKVFQDKKVSGKYHEGAIGFDPVKKDMYITRNQYDVKPNRNRRVEIFKGEDDNVHLKIFKLSYLEGEGKFGEELSDPFNFDSEDYSVAFPAIMADGQTMLFASNMEDGFGGMDLYMCTNQGGIWGNPVNLGPEVNTPGDETYPYIGSDGTIYFASDGHLGYGGLDIFKMMPNEDGSYDYPRNMKKPINSDYDDYSIVFTKGLDKGYFTSNRPEEGKGYDDIYSFDIKGITFCAKVYDEKTLEALPEANVSLSNLDEGTTQQALTDAEGNVCFPVLPFNNYEVSASKENYLPRSAKFQTADEDMEAEIPLVNNYGIILDVLVQSDKGEALSGASVTVINKSTGQEEQQLTNADGKTSFVLKEDMQYEILTDASLPDQCQDYAAIRESLSTVGVQSPSTISKTIQLKYLYCDMVSIIPIYYDLDKDYIRADAALELNKVVQLLRENPGMTIELSSHTDCRGSASYNRDLSSRRATSAVNYIIGRGIDRRRLTAAGYGETRLVNHCSCEGGSGPGRTDPACNDVEHQRNRRYRVYDFESVKPYT